MWSGQPCHVCLGIDFAIGELSRYKAKCSWIHSKQFHELHAFTNPPKDWDLCVNVFLRSPLIVVTLLTNSGERERGGT